MRKIDSSDGAFAALTEVCAQLVVDSSEDAAVTLSRRGTPEAVTLAVTYARGDGGDDFQLAGVPLTSWHLALRAALDAPLEERTPPPASVHRKR